MLEWPEGEVEAAALARAEPVFSYLGSKGAGVALSADAVFSYLGSSGDALANALCVFSYLGSVGVYAMADSSAALALLTYLLVDWSSIADLTNAGPED